MTTSNFLALLHQANQAAAERFAELENSANLTLRQVQLLASVAEQHEPSQTDLCTATGIDRSTVADIVKRLVSKKLIERRRSKKDARAYVVRLTPQGREDLARSRPLMKAVEDQLLGSMSAKQRADLLAQLERLVSSGAAKPANS